MFTFLSKDELEEKIASQKKSPENRLCQKYLAKFLTDLVHGFETTDRVEKLTQVLFEGDVASLKKEEIEEAFEDVKNFSIKKDTLKNLNLADFLTNLTICSSKRQAREDIQNKAIVINGIIYSDVLEKVTDDKVLFNKYIVVRRGKKSYFLVKVE